MSRHLLRPLLYPVSRLAGTLAQGQLRGFLAACDRAEQTQEAMLLRLVHNAAGSDFGRQHALDKVRSLRDFRQAVPVRDYEGLRPWMQQVLEGKVEALFAPGTQVVMFAVSSGTTGLPKHIPVTHEFMANYRRGWNIWGVKALADHHDAWLKKIVAISSNASEWLSPTGLPCGAISGLLAQTQQWIVRRMYPVSPAVGRIADPDAKYYTILRSSIVGDIGILTTANPSSAIRLAQAGRDNAERLIRDIREGTLTPPGHIDPAVGRHFHFRPNPSAARRLEGIASRHGSLLPRHYWKPGFIGHWTGGTLGLYLPAVRELYGPETPIRDIGLLASEGRFSISLDDNTAQGVAEITSNFLEFIPAEQIEKANPDVLLAHEVQVGQEYFLVISNCAGLWRYSIDDRVRVNGFQGRSPVIEFLSKGQHVSSITGEKLTEHQVVAAMALVGQRGICAVETFELQGCFEETPYYALRLERGRDDAQVLADKLDTALRELNIEYASKRSTGRLGAIRPLVLDRGSFARQEAAKVAQRRGRGEQYKHKYLLTDVVYTEARRDVSPS